MERENARSKERVGWGGEREWLRSQDHKQRYGGSCQSLRGDAREIHSDDWLIIVSFWAILSRYSISRVNRRSVKHTVWFENHHDNILCFYLFIYFYKRNREMPSFPEAPRVLHSAGLWFCSITAIIIVKETTTTTRVLAIPKIVGLDCTFIDSFYRHRGPSQGRQ